jgi:predicted ATP-binding protein involved in virulence
MFDHVIPLNLDSHITIVYGENGIGKTMIFRILDAVVQKRFYTLGKLPFQKFTIAWTDDSWLTVRRDTELTFESSTHSKAERLSFLDRPYDSVDDYIQYLITNPKVLLDLLKTQDVENLMLRKSKFRGSEEFLYSMDRFRMGINFPKMRLQELVRETYRELPEIFQLGMSEREFQCPPVLEKILNRQQCYFIETQRLFVDAKMNASFEQGNVFQLQFRPSIEYFSQELAALIKGVHEQYQKVTEQLEISLRNRLTDGSLNTNFQDGRINDLQKSVSRRRLELREVGLLDEQDLEPSKDFQGLSEISKAILGVNLLDMKEKLAVFDDTYNKLKLFLTIVNDRRFTHKKLSIHTTRGFIFSNSLGDVLSLVDLSSGEQHELILLYQLLFKVPQNAFILIDEPEISLHIAWQKAFIQDMSEIIKLRGFDLMVATHAPAIINGQWDYTVSLTSKEVVHG